MLTHYETLGVAQDATTDEINRAYRKLALQYHPDKKPGDTEAKKMFETIGTAKDILTDDIKRIDYDRALKAEQEKAQAEAAKAKPATVPTSAPAKTQKKAQVPQPTPKQEAKPKPAEPPKKSSTEDLHGSFSNQPKPAAGDNLKNIFEGHYGPTSSGRSPQQPSKSPVFSDSPTPKTSSRTETTPGNTPKPKETTPNRTPTATEATSKTKPTLKLTHADFLTKSFNEIENLSKNNTVFITFVDKKNEYTSERRADNAYYDLKDKYNTMRTLQTFFKGAEFSENAFKHAEKNLNLKIDDQSKLNETQKLWIALKYAQAKPGERTDNALQACIRDNGTYLSKAAPSPKN